MNTIGRKKTTASVLVILGFWLLMIVPLTYTMYGMFTILKVFQDVQLFFLGGELYLFHIYTAEMFPTYMRGTALVLCSFPAFILEYALRMTLGELDFWV